MLLPDLHRLREKIKPSSTQDGDGKFSFPLEIPAKSSLLAISAIALAVNMIAKHCKKLKYRRKIILVTNGSGDMDSEGSEDIIDKIKSDEMDLVVV